MQSTSALTLCQQVKTGSKALDSALKISGGVITLRSTKQKWLSKLAAGILVLNYKKNSSSLLLNWLDYHQRYWSLDLDYLIKIGNGIGIESEELVRSIIIHRCFSRDNIESPEFWAALGTLPKELRLVVLDSFTELYESDPVKEENKPKIFPASMFNRLVSKHDAIGIILDYSKKTINPYLAQISSVIIEFKHDEGLYAQVIKHPYLADPLIEIPVAGQQILKRWTK